jgi:hypothetical protein
MTAAQSGRPSRRMRVRGRRQLPAGGRLHADDLGVCSAFLDRQPTRPPGIPPQVIHNGRSTTWFVSISDHGPVRRTRAFNGPGVPAARRRRPRFTADAVAQSRPPRPCRWVGQQHVLRTCTSRGHGRSRARYGSTPMVVSRNKLRSCCRPRAYVAACAPREKPRPGVPRSRGGSTRSSNPRCGWVCCRAEGVQLAK